MAKSYNMELRFEPGRMPTVCIKSKFYWRIVIGTQADMKSKLYAWLDQASAELAHLDRLFADRPMSPALEMAYEEIKKYKGVIPFGQWRNEVAPGDVLEFRFRYIKRSREKFARLFCQDGHIYLQERPYEGEMLITHRDNVVYF